MKKAVITMLLASVLGTTAYAQFFSPLERKVWRDIFPAVTNAAHQVKNDREPNTELPWVTLVKEAEKILKYPPSVEFNQEEAPKGKGFLFQKRKYLIQQGVASNALLKGYDVIVPRPVDLTSLYENDVTSVGAFFKQGTTWGDVPSFFRNQSAKKYQEGMVEIRFQPQDSENTFIFLIDVPHTRIYIFLNKYKNKK